jgi:steroid 5-alpha reductase family enzyme
VTSSLAGLSRRTAFGIVALSYVVAGIAGFVVVALLPTAHPIAAALWGDLVATLVIFGLSMAIDNASLYDPYWSVAPPVIALAWLAGAPDGVGLRQALVIVLIGAWAVRLTANWGVGWRGMTHEDWRYVQLRQDRGRVPWWVVNLTGIQLVPTLFVFGGLLSVWPALTGTRPVNWLDVLAVLVTCGAIALEAVSDRQLRRFTASPARQGRIAEVGLWRWSRHPNYLGEISFWWGLWLFGLAAAPSWWWSVVGPLAMVGLFLGISIPLMERRSAKRRRDWADYVRRTPVLVPWHPPR